MSSEDFWNTVAEHTAATGDLERQQELTAQAEQQLAEAAKEDN